MAYFDPHGAFVVPHRAVALAAAEGVAFSPLERTVILLAKNDTLRSLRTPSRLSRAFGSVMGVGVSSTLADPRLEALRRLAVHAWRQARLPAAEVRRFLDAGFAPAQITLLANLASDAQAAQDDRA